MRQAFEGQCQCGAVNYRVTGISATLFACHCTECQRQAGSAFGMALWIREPLQELLTGPLKEWIRDLPSGRRMACDFCAECGTRLFHRILGQTQILSIKPGTLRDLKGLRPVGHIWTQSQQDWFDIRGDTLQYTANPESYDALLRAWEQVTAHTDSESAGGS